MSLNRLDLQAHVEEFVRSNTRTAYDDILKHFGLPRFNGPNQWRDCPLYALIGQIDEQDIDAHRPLRTSVIVQRVKGKLTIPRDGYFKTLCWYRRIPMPKTSTEKIRMHNDELAALRAYCDGGTLVESEDSTY